MAKVITQERAKGGAGDPDYLDRLITEREAADFLGYTVRALQNWRVRGGAGPDRRGPKFVRVSKRSIRYRRRDLIAWAEARLREHTSEQDTLGRSETPCGPAHPDGRRRESAPATGEPASEDAGRPKPCPPEPPSAQEIPRRTDERERSAAAGGQEQKAAPSPAEEPAAEKARPRELSRFHYRRSILGQKP